MGMPEAQEFEIRIVIWEVNNVPIPTGVIIFRFIILYSLNALIYLCEWSRTLTDGLGQP